MKTNELRIGNRLMYDGDVVEVTMIGMQACVCRRGDKFIAITIGNVEPIPLTSDYLKEIGAEEARVIKDNRPLFKYDRFNIIYNQKYRFWVVIDYTSSVYITKVEYVHELQNVLFVLNGEIK